jgi:hypothetical protein
MANLSTVSPMAGAIQGVSQGIQNYGAIQGVMQNRDKIQREAELYPLQKRALEQEGAVRTMQLKEQERLNTPVEVDGLLNQYFKDKPMTRQAVEGFAMPFVTTVDGKRMIRQGDIPEVFKAMNTDVGVKRVAIGHLADLSAKIEQLKLPTETESPTDRVTREMSLKTLQNQYTMTSKLIDKASKATPLYDPQKKIWEWFGEDYKIIRELSGKIPEGAMKAPDRPTIVAPGGVVLGPDNKPVFTNPAKKNTGAEEKPYKPTIADKKKLADMVNTATADGTKDPSVTDITVIQSAADQLGMDFVNNKGSKPGMLWGTNPTSTWDLVPKVSATGKGTTNKGSDKKDPLGIRK